MKLFIYIILINLYIVHGFSQNEITNNGYTSNSDEYALINDVKRIEFDKENSRVSFDFISEETSGTISGLDFKIDFNPEDIENASFKGTALIKTLDTDNFLRDGHLMWEKFFYKKKYPTISFSSSQVVPFESNTFKVIGNLTIKGKQKEVIITFTLDKSKLLGKTIIYTSDFDVNIHDEREKNKLEVQFHFPILE